MLISIRKLHKQYETVCALNSIDLEIGGGGIIGLLGPNGAGKTTLVETIEGLRMPTSGSLRVLGVDPTTSPAELKEKIGVQLQATPLPDELTPAETLRLFAALFKKSLPVESILERMNLRDKAHARNRTLSGGQKQRVAIGMALINDPQLVILDEPTTGLDPMARRELHDIIAGLRDQGRTVLLTTHYIEEAEKLCERVIIIRDGEIVADDSPFDLVSRAAGTSTMWISTEGGDFDFSSLVSAGAIAQGREGEYYRFSTDNPTSLIVSLGALLKKHDITLKDLRMKRPTLEDVYLDYVKVNKAEIQAEG